MEGNPMGSNPMGSNPMGSNPRGHLPNHFHLGYSPERINPGDPHHRLTTIKKVTSGSSPAIAAIIDALYRQIITAGTHVASSIRVAEAAKVIENTQRDLNIALMNELALIFGKLALIFGKLGIDTLEVLEAAGSQWNFLPFRPAPAWLAGTASASTPPVSRSGPHPPGHRHRPSPRGDPRRPAHQRPHGRLCRGDGGQASCPGS